MITFPNAKINIGLNVVEKRADGFHNLETVFYPIQLADALEVAGSNQFSFQVTGINLDSPPEDNLVVKAYRLLKKEYHLPPVKIHLHKVIPFGAGLGGGSSDAAFMLKMLNRLFKLNLPVSTLEKYAVKLGADCAFFIRNRPSLASGKGEILSPVGLGLSNYSIILIKPPFSVGTADAYRDIVPEPPGFPLKKTIEKTPPRQWKDYLSNNFETSVFQLFPEIAKIKEKLYDIGAVFASMTGSGSAVWGLFEDLPVNIDNSFPDDYMVYRQ
ncbi:MAG: 4-(cytidine 5'-diphospho)-2-C-methyl-D-erythritol kinase [Chlorobi bacterium]|nr:4-(cytidine 5'-diphospho)-2-C-methyl-D-erythritol kinase [Chlorobiota bacterium]